MADHNTLGHNGEDFACEYLISNGFSIVERNWRLHHLEIDIVALRDNIYSFIEVKTRSADTDPRILLSRSKCNNIRNAALGYMRTHSNVYYMQVDLLFLLKKPDGSYDVQYFPAVVR